MSREELEYAYKRGRLSRRDFVRGLTAAGLSIAAANRMADQTMAAPGESSEVRSAATHRDDVYDVPKQVTALPSTGAGATETSSRSERSGILGLLGVSAALAALGIRKRQETEEEPQ